MIRARNNPVEEASFIAEERKPLSPSPKRTTTSTPASFAGQLSASSLQLYQSIKQHAKRKKSAVWSKNNNGIWTVEVPKRMLFSTLGVFLVLPLLIFAWKELHPSAPSNELRGSKDKIVLRNGKDKYVTWLEDNLPEFNETEDEDGRAKSIEVIAKGSSKFNNETEDESSETFLVASKHKFNPKNDETRVKDVKEYREQLIAQLEGKPLGKKSEKSTDGRINNKNMEEQVDEINVLFDDIKKKMATQATVANGDDDDDNNNGDDSVDDKPNA